MVEMLCSYTGLLLAAPYPQSHAAVQDARPGLECTVSAAHLLAETDQEGINVLLLARFLLTPFADVSAVCLRTCVLVKRCLQQGAANGACMLYAVKSCACELCRT